MARQDNYRRKMVELASRFGREVRLTKGNHLALVVDGKVPIIASCSPKNGEQALRNTLRILKQHHERGAPPPRHSRSKDG